MKVSARIERTGLALAPSDAEKALGRSIGPAVAARIAATKTRLRDDTRSALGGRMANTWRVAVYPVARPTKTLNPAGFVWSNASTVVSAFDPGATIKARNAQYMAIPTEHVPRAGRNGRRLSPVEVEAAYNQELEIMPSLTRPGTFLLALTARRGKRGIRQIRAKTQQGFWRQAERFVMFVLVKQVRLRPLLSWRRIVAAEQTAFDQAVRGAVANALQPYGGAR